jgi:hypothetical protein
MSPQEKDAIERASRLTPTVHQEIGNYPQASPIESVIQVEFETGSLPVAQANAQTFIDLIGKTLKATLGEELRALLTRNQVDLTDISLKRLDRMMPMSIGFSDGTIEYDQMGKRTYVQLTGITISAVSEYLRIGVRGTSDDAEKALGKVYECVYEAAGMKSQWADGREKIVAKGYATATIETLDAGLDKVLAPGVAGLFNTQNFAAKGFDSALGSQPINKETGQPFIRSCRAVLKLGTLDVNVIRLDDETGYRYDSTIRISPVTKSDAGLGRYIVTSELEYNKHKEFVTLLRNSLAKA